MSIVLDTHERRSGVAMKLAAYVAARLGEHREENDGSLTADETARLRGRIAELKHIQDLLATGES